MRFIVENEFGGALAVGLVGSEREFLVRLPALEANRPAAIILDLILPWEDGVHIGTTEYTEPRGEIYDAGVRILEDLSRSAGLKNVPVALYTVTDKRRIELPPAIAKRTEILQKGDPDRLLISWLKRKLISWPLL